MRTSSKFVLAGIIIFVSYIIDLVFFRFGLEILAIIGYILFGIIVIWIVHGIRQERRRSHRAEEFLTQPLLMVTLAVVGIAFILVSIYNFLITKSIVLVNFLFLIEIGVLLFLLAWNNWREGQKRGHW